MRSCYGQILVHTKELDTYLIEAEMASWLSLLRLHQSDLCLCLLGLLSLRDMRQILCHQVPRLLLRLDSIPCSNLLVRIVKVACGYLAIVLSLVACLTLKWVLVEACIDKTRLVELKLPLGVVVDRGTHGEAVFTGLLWLILNQGRALTRLWLWYNLGCPKINSTLRLRLLLSFFLDDGLEHHWKVLGVWVQRHRTLELLSNIWIRLLHRRDDLLDAWMQDTRGFLLRSVCCICCIRCRRWWSINLWLRCDHLLCVWIRAIYVALALLDLLLAAKRVGLLSLRLGHLVTLPIVVKESSLHLHMPLVHLLLLLLLKLLLVHMLLPLVVELVEVVWKDSPELLMLHVHHMRRLMHQVVAHHLLRCQVVTSLHLIGLILVVLVSTSIVCP